MKVKRKEKGAGEPGQHNVRAGAPAAAPQSAPAAAQLSSTGHRCSRQKTLLTKPLSENTRIFKHYGAFLLVDFFKSYLLHLKYKEAEIRPR